MAITDLSQLPDATLVAHYRADDYTAGDWPDRTANGYDLAQATEGNQPAAVADGGADFNNQPVVRFDGSDDFLSEATFSLNQPYTIITISKMTVDNRPNSASMVADNGGIGPYMGAGGSAQPRVFAGGTLNGSGSILDTRVLMEGFFSGASSVLRLNSTINASGNAGTDAMSGIRVGSVGTGANDWGGDIAEVGIFDGELTSAGRIALAQYAADYYTIEQAIKVAEGAPQSQAADVSGTVIRTAIATGSLGSGGSAIDGEIIRKLFAEGSPQAQNAAIAGMLAREVKASGTPQAQESAVGGDAFVGFIAEGALAAANSDVAGSAEVSGVKADPPNGVTFDGVNDFLTRDGDLTDNADSKLLTWSVWFQVDPVSSTLKRIYQAANGVSLMFQAGGSLSVVGVTAAAEVNLFATSHDDFDDGAWHHWMGSIDLNDSGNRHFYVDDSPVDVTWTTYDNSEIDFTVADHAIGGATTGSQLLPGNLAQLWIEPGVHIDLSIEANRRRFVGPSAASSVGLGSDGSTPTGSAPLIFLNGETATWHVNKGTGGGFTENGALEDSATDPPLPFGVATGALQAQQPVIDGMAAREVFASGTPQAQDAVVAGEGTRQTEATGALEAADADITGFLGGILATGEIKAGAATVAGAVTRVAKASGDLASGAASIIGQAAIFVQGIASGALKAGASVVNGTASLTANAAGVLVSGASVVSGAATLTRKASGALASGASSVSGAVVGAAKAVGALVSGAAAIVGRLVINIVRPSFALSTTMSDAPMAVQSLMVGEVPLESTIVDAPTALEARMSDEVALESKMSDEPEAHSTTLAP